MHSVMHFCPSDSESVVVEKWRSFDEKLGVELKETTTARRRRDVEGPIHSYLRRGG